jgi:hypothetical protein
MPPQSLRRGDVVHGDAGGELLDEPHLPLRGGQGRSGARGKALRLDARCRLDPRDDAGQGTAGEDVLDRNLPPGPGAQRRHQPHGEQRVAA